MISMKTIVYNQDGKEAGTVILPKETFEIKMSPDLVYQVVTVQMANRRNNLAHAKGRSEVSGGGKKPWKQKGTGRARHGSIRSPLWKGGGVTFGPSKEKMFGRKISKKMRRSALKMVLSAKAANGLLFVLDNFNIAKPKTKLAETVIRSLPLKKSTCLIALPSLEKNAILALRNLPNLKTMQARDLNCLDLMSYKYLILPKESIKVIKEIL